MEEGELKYMLYLLDGLNEALFEDIINLYYDLEEQKPFKGLSDEVLEFFVKNLKINPVTAARILAYFQSSLKGNDSELKNIHDIYIKTINEILNSNNIDMFISLLSVLQFDKEFLPDLVNKVLQYIPKEIFEQHKKQIFISLIVQQHPELLSICSRFLENDACLEHINLTPENMLKLCYKEEKHWLLNAIQVCKHQIQDMNNVTFKINNFTKQILIMVLIDIMNSQDNSDISFFFYNNLFAILNSYDTSDKELKFYIVEVKRELALIKFCIENDCKFSSSSIVTQIMSQNALALIAQVCKLSKVDRYKVSRLLQTNNELLHDLAHIINKEDKIPQLSFNWDIMTYNSYCALTNTIDCVLNSTEVDNTQEITTSMEDVKRLVSSLHPIEFRIEIIENLFTCLFLRYEQFSNDDDVQESIYGALSDCSYFFSKKLNRNTALSKKISLGFICSSNTTINILNTLKQCLDELEDVVKNLHMESAVVVKFKNLVRMINHGLWKQQLVSTLSPESAPVPKLCLDYVDVAETSDDDDVDQEIRSTKRKIRVKRRHTNPKTDGDQVMISSSISANGEGSYTPLVNSVEFISVMLAKPNSLVALALYHNDFVKANQIIEMFDLADADIATEVQFTEKLRNLVSKIKNILHYKDDTRYPTKELSALSVVSTQVMGLVEGFLSSNRSPNSVEIMELSTRHSHLQLYNHQNAPFVNAVDILLSGGLNREITYGLINVVERKLAEVRAGTDIASVRKTNYIRFVEDIASVTFEILGNTDKSFDFVDNVCGIINDCRIPIKHKEFRKLNLLAKDLKKGCKDLEEIVKTNIISTIDINLTQKYHQTYMNVVAASDKDLYNIGEVCHILNKKSRVHYLRMCYMYCKTVAQMEDIEEVAPYFSVLGKQLHHIIGNLIINKEVPINSLEATCKKLNINLIHKIILNFCPAIPLGHYNKDASESVFNNLLQMVYDYQNMEEKLFLEPTANFSCIQELKSPQCLTYLVLNNWVLAHIVKKIHSATSGSSLQQSMDGRTKFINNYMDLQRFDYLKTLFGNNRYLASMYTTIDLDDLLTFMPKLIELGKILKCLNIIDALSEHQLLSSANLMNLRDLILFKLSIHPHVETNWKYCHHLKCPELKVNLILNNLNCWPIEGAMDVLEHLMFLLDDVATDEGLYGKCKYWILRIPLYDQIASIMGESNWYAIYEKSVESSEEIIDMLMDSQQYKLCLEWADLHDITDNMKSLIITNLLRQLFEYTNQATPIMIKELLMRLPVSQALELIHREKSKIKSVEILQVCIEYVSEYSCDLKSFENIKIGLLIMLAIDVNLRPLFWDLIEYPLLMLEQFLMNGKLDILTTIINKIADNLKTDPSGDNLYYNIKTIESLVISRNAVDALLRFYAEKALDMKNPRNSYTPPPKPLDDCLMQSIDSINIEAANRPFVMPEQIPSKEQWVQDSSTDRCMMCHTSIFSMIIRRHHCRRCGRLVCHACSRNRMQVPTYPPGIKFRVCDDCYSQTMDKINSTEQDSTMLSSNSESMGSGVTCMDWCLSHNAQRNEAVRNEFSYEFIPNVTLCLSIMKMHSINLEYPKFLLDRSDEVAREVCRNSDARLLVRARRSLLLAAAELYARTPTNKHVTPEWSRVAEAGAAHAARCVALSAALATLVRHYEHRTLHARADPSLHSHIVRSLLESEQWDLALEIATKSGLPRTSVLAAWGKACLKAGCYKRAREKFSHCFKSSFQPTVFEGADDCEYGREASEISPTNKRTVSLRSSSVSSVQSEGRPRTNPPLLYEIINILEEINYPVNQQLLAKAESIKATNEKLAAIQTNKKKIQLTEPALNIMHSLASVKKIRNGDYSDFQTATVQPKKTMAQTLLRRNNHNETKGELQSKKLDSFFYKECVYYLTNYGSHSANIAFYMKHSNLLEVLTYCYDNAVEKEIFTESVYLECMKKDSVKELIACMNEMDSTLELWSDYITHTCRHLESTNRLEALLALQCGTGQAARAAATCARLYCKPAPRNALLSTLRGRHGRLTDAAALLDHAPAFKSTNPNSFNLQLDKVTREKHLTTISRQMELVKFLAECESRGRLSDILTSELMCDPEEVSGSRDIRPLTLFGTQNDRTRLAAICLIAGNEVKDGFNLAYKIILDYKLDSGVVYKKASRVLVSDNRYAQVGALAACVRDTGAHNASELSDSILETGVRTLVSTCAAKGQLHDEVAEILIQDIKDVHVQISCYLECRNLSSAYILAVRHSRPTDLRRVLREAERLQHDNIKLACLKRLHNAPQTKSDT